MRLAWFIGGLTLLMSTTGCCCGSCGWGKGRGGYPATYQASAPQYGTPGSYASSPSGSPMGSTAMADGSMAPAGGSASASSQPLPTARSSMSGSGVETISHEVPAGE